MDETNVIKILKSVFGYTNFQNTVQKDAIAAIIEGAKCVCVSMPPGAGRSLCFQLPAILQEGKVAVVFSTKLSFMKKQIDFLRSKQINACLIHQSMYISKRNVILNDLTSTSPKTILLYATTNMAVITYFQKLMLSLKQRCLLSYIVFNEAHCLSKLGYEYTPAYKKIDQLNKIYEYVPQIAITTTVTDEVIKDICNVLKLKAPKIFKLTAQKINVYCDVWFLDIISQPFEHLKNFIMEVLGFLDATVHEIHRSFAIIYCREAVTAESLKNKLNASGISALTYHHKLNNCMQKSVENKWISGDACVITTTYNYGFIYKKSIRCTVYWTVPESIAKYYRESAQTHSDSTQTYCRIYFSVKEYSSVKESIEKHNVMNDTEHIKWRLNEYNKFVSYCLLDKCRHVIISNYFGCTMPSCKTDCDVCKHKEMVEIRTFKFITFSEGVEGVKYNICDMSRNLPIKGTDVKSDTSNEKRSEDILKDDSRTPKVTYKETATVEDADKWIVQYNAKLLLNKQKQLSVKSSSSVDVESRSNNRKRLPVKVSFPVKAELRSNKQIRLPVKSNSLVNAELQSDKQKRFPAKSSCPVSPGTNVAQIDARNAANCDKDNVDVMYIGTSASQPLIRKNNLNTWLTWQQPSTSEYSSAKDTSRRRNTVKIIDKIHVPVNESRINVSNNVSWTKADERSFHDSSINSNKPVIVDVKNYRKRVLVVEPSSENITTKRRRLNSDDKASTEAEERKDERIVADHCVKRAKNDANVSGSRDKAIIERLMNKYNLNSESITLEIQKKKRS